MTEIDVIELENQIHANVYHRYPVTINKGKDNVLWDNKGKEYIDCMGGYGVAVIGHCNQFVVDSIKKQADELITCHNSLYNQTRAKFISRLISITPMELNKVVLCNTGAETIECAIKIARKFTQKPEIISMIGSYHGKTMGALSATWNKKYRQAFAPLLPDIKFSPFGKEDRLEELITERTAAILLEPIQGESGIHVAPKEFLNKIRQICNKKNILMICDEIQSGFGRTGKMWAFQHWNIIPDIICTAKGLGGGLPISATIGKEEIMNCLGIGDHSSTFSGNPLSCAAGNATIEYMTKNNLIENAKKKGELFKTELDKLKNNHKSIREIRGMGLMLAIEMKFDIREILLQALENGVILLYSGRNNIRLLPPLTITNEQIIKVCKIIDKILTDLEE